MILGIDASRYQHSEPTGVEWYSYHIINELVALLKDRKDLTVKLYTKPGQDLGHLEQGAVSVQEINRTRFWTIKGLTKEIKNNPPNILFVPSHALPIRLPIRSVITIHDVAFKYFEKAYGVKQRAYLDWTTKFAVKMATKIIVPSSATKDDLIKLFGCYPEKIKVIEHGFDKPKALPNEELFKTSEALSYFNLSKDLPYFLFVGRLEKKKNLVRLVEAFAKFSEKHNDYKLILAGKRGVGFEEILQKVKNLNLAEKIVMPGYIDENEKATLFEHCKAFVFPSLYEGFGLPVLESFYYKKPVLVSSGSSLTELAGEAAVTVDAHDTESISRGLEMLLNENETNRLIAAGEQKLKDYSWQKAAKETLKVLLKEND